MKTKAKPIIKTTAGKHQDVICGSCGHKHNNVFVTESRIYFPNRYIYGRKALPMLCTNCRNSYNMVIFGQQFVSGIPNFEILQKPAVIENNRLYKNLTK